MAGVSLTTPPAAFACQFCAQPSRADKAGPGCAGCPAFVDTHYYPHASGHTPCDVYVLGDHPAKPPLFPSLRPGRDVPQDHAAFQDTAGRVVRGIVTTLQREPRFRDLRVRYGYAVRCAVTKASHGMVAACGGNLRADLATARPRVVVALGVEALHALGVDVRTEKDAVHRVYDVVLGELPLKVVFVRSLKAIGATPGTHEMNTADVAHALQIAIDADVKPLSREGMAVGHIYPTTIPEVRDVVDYVLGYSERGVEPLKWSVSTDTETDTLYPTKGVTLVCASFAWASAGGAAAAIPLWHKDAPYDPAAAWPHVKRLWQSGKPFVLHGAKYDLKVARKLGTDIANVRWDTLLAEHALREDARGYNDLKALTAEFFPEYAGYQRGLRAQVEEDTAEEVQAAVEAATRANAIPEELLFALARLKLSPKFRPATLLKRIEEWRAQPQLDDTRLHDAFLLINAHAAGAFRAKKSVVRRVVTEGGYENVDLPELLFYAAVDADMTRRLAVSQSDRMVAEDARRAREVAEAERAAAWSPGGVRFHFVKRCDTPRPRHDLVYRRYVPRLRELNDIEYHGWRIDTEYLKQAKDEIGAVVVQKAQQLFAMAGEEFKPKAPVQLARLMCDTGIGYLHPDKERAGWLAENHPTVFKFDGARLMYRVPVKETGESPIRFTATGAVQMDAAFLKRIAAGYRDPFADLNLEFRKAHTIQTSFLENIGRLVEFYGDGWIRPGYNQNGCATARLSSSSGVKGIGFNNQNIVKKPVGGVNCKKLFVPDNDDFVVANIDGAGAEVGVLTAYARAVRLIDAILAGQDTHCFFASVILNPDSVAEGKTGSARALALKLANIDDAHAWSYDDFYNGAKKKSLTDLEYQVRLYDLRENIKRVVFGTLFGAGPRKIAEIAGIPVSFATKVRDLFFARFPEVREAIEHAHWCLRTFGFNETFFGRLRRFVIADAPSEMKARAERQGFNFLIQSTNSDIVLDVLCDLAAVVRELGGRLLGTVHDSVIIQFPKRHLDQLGDIVHRYGTEKVAREKPWLPVPFKWDIEVGPSYGELTKLKDYLAKTHTEETHVVPELHGLDKGEILDELRDAEAPSVFVRGAKAKPN